MPSLYIGRPTEILLKAPATRRRMFGLLLHNLRALGVQARILGGLVLIQGESPHISLVFGLRRVEKALLFDNYEDALSFAAGQVSPAGRLKVSRQWKGFEKTSLDIRHEIKSQAHGSADYLSFTVIRDGFLVGVDPKDGPGGLPLGSQRRLSVFLEEDWPIGVFYLMRRGSPINLENPPPCIKAYHIGHAIGQPQTIDAIITRRPTKPGYLYPVAGLSESFLRAEQQKWCQKDF